MYSQSVNSIVFAAMEIIENVIGSRLNKSSSYDNNKLSICCDDTLTQMEEGRSKDGFYVVMRVRKSFSQNIFK